MMCEGLEKAFSLIFQNLDLIPLIRKRIDRYYLMVKQILLSYASIVSVELGKGYRSKKFVSQVLIWLQKV